MELYLQVIPVIKLLIMLSLAGYFYYFIKRKEWKKVAFGILIAIIFFVFAPIKLAVDDSHKQTLDQESFNRHQIKIEKQEDLSVTNQEGFDPFMQKTEKRNEMEYEKIQMDLR